jgi:large subunit ribosomal protein L11
MSVVRIVRLRVSAGVAKPGPALGQALGPLGINMMEFCKQFNERSDKLYERETPLTVSLTAMSDRTFQFVVKTPPTTYLLKKVAQIEKGASAPSPGRPIGYVTPEAVYEIAKIKQMDSDLMYLCPDSVARSIVGSAKSMGLAVREANDV